MANGVPRRLVDYLLFGADVNQALERYTQNGGVAADVWYSFADRPNERVRVLVTPSAGIPTINLAHGLARVCSLPTFRTDRAVGTEGHAKESSNISLLQSQIALDVTLSQLVCRLLPLSSWWHEAGLGHLTGKAASNSESLTKQLRSAIELRLGEARQSLSERVVAEFAADNLDEKRKAAALHWRLKQATQIAALIGVLWCASDSESGATFLSSLRDGTALEGSAQNFRNWLFENAEGIAEGAISAINEAVVVENQNLQFEDDAFRRAPNALPSDTPWIHMVFLDRKAVPTQIRPPSQRRADLDARATIKADAADRLFGVSCAAITWAVIDSGISSDHLAFRNHKFSDRSRVKAAFDFSLIEDLRSFELIHPAFVEKVIERLVAKPFKRRLDTDAFRAFARKKLNQIGQQIEAGISPDWSLLEGLMRIESSDGTDLPSHHGTHVAGILGADWRDGTNPDDSVMRGVCPDINLYDLRVVGADMRATEFAAMAALEFVEYLNAREPGNARVIHGVNMSLSIPHDVRNYGCGATPICEACDRLVGAGVCVVVAAGNRGWNESEGGFGAFVYASITDPGNSREAITVGATHPAKPHTYGVCYFSSRGPTGDGRIKPDLVAPGERIVGPVDTDASRILDGTSMAAPFVSGAAAILMARHRELIGRPRRIKEILCSTATDLGREKYFQGHGLVDVLRALQSI